MTVRPTSWRTLLALALLAAAVGWAVTQLVDHYADRTLPVPLTMPVVLTLLALALALWARGTRARLAGRPGTRPLDPIVAARSAALAMAASRTGSLVCGFYVGVVLALLPDWGFETVRQKAVVALASAVTALLVVAAGLWLERVCRLPDDPTPADDYDDDSV